MTLAGACGGLTEVGCSSVTIQDEGIAQGDVNTLNFVGTGVSVSVSSETATITVSGGGGTPGGADTQVQYNDGGAFGGDASFTWDDTNKILSTPALKLTEVLGAEMIVDGSFAAPTQYNVPTANVSISPDQITISPDPGWVPGDVITYGSGGGAVIGSLEDGDTFFVRTNTAGVITFSATVGGAAFNMTGTGNNAQFFAKVNWLSATTGVTGGVPNWVLYNGKAEHQLAGTASLTPVVALVPVPGQLYKLTYTVANWTVAGTTAVFGGTTGQLNTAPTGNGTYTVYITPVNNTGLLLFTPVTGFRADITNVSLKPVLSGITTGSDFPLVINRTLSDATANQNALELNYTINKTTEGDTVGLLINSNETSAPGTDYLIRAFMSGTSRFAITNAGALTISGALVMVGALSGVTTYSASAQQVYTSSAGASLAVTLANGALYTAGTATTNFPMNFCQQTGTTAVTTWDTGGTYYGVNAASGFAGNFLDFHVAGGASLFKVDETGLMTIGNFSAVGSYIRFQLGSTSQVLFNGTGQIKMPADGVLQLLNDGSTGFTGIKLGGLTSSFPYIKVNSTAIDFRLADDSAYCAISASTVTVQAGGSLINSGRGSLSAQGDGLWTFYDNAATSFGRLCFGGTTSSFPAIKRNGTVLEAKLADDSAYATFASNTISLQAASQIVWATRGYVEWPADGVLSLRDNAGTSFGRLNFGGATSSFPALKRSGTVLAIRLADDSADAAITAASTIFTSQAAATVATVIKGAASRSVALLNLQNSAAASMGNVGGCTFDNFADVSVGGAEADIYSSTTVANALAINGDKITANYGGNFVTVGTELTQLKVYFAGTAIWDSTGVAPSTGTTSWRVFVEIIRVSSTVVRYSVSLNTTGASGYTYCTVGELTSLTLSGTNILKITGTSSGVGSGAGDIVGKMGSVSYFPAA